MLDRIHIELDVYREQHDPKNVLVCFSEDYHSEQRHLIQSSRVPVSRQSIIECLTKIVAQMLDNSVFGGGQTNGCEKDEADRSAQAR